MLLSRFWYFVLAAGCGIAFAAALLTQSAFNRQYDADLNDQLRRDRFELELMLKTDARARLDAIAPLAAHPDIRSGLRRANARDEKLRIPGEIRTAIQDKLQGLNRQLEGMSADFLVVVDEQGYIVGQLGSGTPPAGAGLGAFPLVERALAGYLRDDVWVYNGRVFRMAARPVIDNGQYVGAIVHGMELDEELASRLSERLSGATVAFFKDDSVIGSHMPSIENAARAEDVEGQLGAALDNPELAEGGRTDPLDLQGGSRAIYSFVTGSASHAGVGYAIARPRHSLASVWDIFDLIAIDDVNTLPLPLLIGGSLLMFGLGMLFLWLERDRPFGRLRHATASLAKREVDRLTITDFGGGYRKVAENVNQAMDKAVETAAAASPKRKAADLDEILGPAPAGGGGGGAGAPAFFGFAEKEGGDEDVPSAPGTSGPGGAPSLPGGPPPSPSGSQPLGPPPAPGAGPGSAPRPPGGPPPAPGAAPPRPGGGAPPPPAPKGPPASPPAASAKAPPPAAEAKQDWGKGTLLGGAGAPQATGGNGPVQAPSSVAARAAAPLPDEMEDEDEGATMIADVPRELLDATSGEQENSEEEQHFREVFDQFVATKKSCGEPTAGLTFDKFVQTLRKNRDQIVSRHGAKSVRFTVYKKDGKAALKATPVKA